MIGQEEFEIKRGGWLTAVLILMFLMNFSVSIFYFLNPNAIISSYPKATETLVYIMAFLALLNVIIAVALWLWKKWAFYGVAVNVVLAFCLNQYLGVSLVSSLGGLLGPMILYFLVRKKLSKFN